MKLYTTSDRLKEIMAERHLRQIDILEMAKPFCDKYGVKLAKNDLSQYVSGKVEPGQEKLTILGLALNVSEAWLMGYNVPSERNQEAEKSTTTGGHSPAKAALIRYAEGLTEDQAVRALQLLKLVEEALG